MRKRLLRDLTTLFLSVSIGGFALSAQADDIAPPRPTDISDVMKKSDSPVLAYQTVTDPDARYSMGGTTAQQTETRRFRPNRPLMLTSAVTFAASYLPAVITAAVDDDTTSDNLFIPIAGPWMEFARDEPSPGNKALLSLSGIFQSLGALGLVSSFFIPERRTANWHLMGHRRFNVAPTASTYQLGLAASGRF
jgi:hypothetical protein